MPDTTLYATGYQGYPEEFCGYPESCVYRYDGSAFHIWEPFGQIPPNNNNYVGYVFDYQGKTYLTGSVRDPVGPGLIATFLRWNGSTWEHVPGWNTQSPIKEILIHNDTLYVAGAFRLATGGPGDLIASFDGENWNDMGGGLSYPPVPNGAAVLDLEWWHGELLASGRISKAGNADCTGIAKWDGHRWCALAGVLHHASGIDAFVSDMAIWRDSLYICGDFSTIDGEPIRQVAQWIGGDATGECSTVGIDEAPRSQAFRMYPNPVHDQLHIKRSAHGPAEVLIQDAWGREMQRTRIHGSTALLDVSALPFGTYCVLLIDRAGVQAARAIKQ